MLKCTDVRLVGIAGNSRHLQAVAIRELAQKCVIRVMTNFSPAWWLGYYAAKERVGE
jgi:hypothetical protein